MNAEERTIAILRAVSDRQCKEVINDVDGLVKFVTEELTAHGERERAKALREAAEIADDPILSIAGSVGGDLEQLPELVAIASVSVLKYVGKSLASDIRELMEAE